MAYMKRMLWLLLALAEIVVVIAGPWLIVVLKMAITALFHKDVFQPNAWYFMGMLLGYTIRYAIRIAPAAILGCHALWLARKRIIQVST